MKNIHLVIADLFLPQHFAAEACAGLRLPALEKMLARGDSAGPAQTAAGSLEELLCEAFGLPRRDDVPIAPVSAMFDGLGGGCDTLLMKPLATRLGEPTTLAKSLVMAKPADCGSSRQAALDETTSHSTRPPQNGGQVAGYPAPEGSASPCQGGCCWLRADPVHLRLQRDQLVLLPEVGVDAGEAAQLCAALNEHFAGQGMAFFAPHPQRWYMRLDRLPDIETVPLSRAAGCNVRGLLPTGKEAARWHRLFNEIQMLLFSHPVNEAREARGELPVNSLWLWGGGVSVPLQKNYDDVSSDEPLAEMFAAAAGIPFSGWPGRWRDEEKSDRQLLVWTGLRSALRRGDLDAWRAALQAFETGYAQPLWQALRAGKISQLQVDILGGDRVRRLLLSRADAWAFWRHTRPLAHYSMV